MSLKVLWGYDLNKYQKAYDAQLSKRLREKLRHEET